jgi:hypothetical protein
LISTIAYLDGSRTNLTEIANGETRPIRNGYINRSLWTDPGGTEWRFNTRITTHPHDFDLEAEIEVTVSKDRAVLFLPMLTAFPGEGSFGWTKGHALFSGVEYLDNEPSSSELDLTGPQSQRQIPPVHDVTIPLMAIQADGSYLGLIWDDARKFGGVFDSPDRTFGSHGHAMGVIWPPADDGGRKPGELLPKSPTLLHANQPLRLHAWIVAGSGESVVPAIKQYVRLRGLAGLPKGPNFAKYSAEAERGWLKSGIHVGDLYRHALAEGGFAPSPVSDAAVFETWLASCEKKTAARAELLDAAKAALTKVDPSSYYSTTLGHIRVPSPAMLFGHVPEAINAAAADAKSQLDRFDSQGRVIYHPAPGGMDFGKGHFAPDANGYTAVTLVAALENAAFSGDRALIDKAVAMLRLQDHFEGSTPRGVQVWELALHTPDIMASSYLTRAYLDGYELTGDRRFLALAEHWAWSGLPFVYLRNPTGGTVGPYATIAVYGATHWQAPDWIGLPVQWCGLVYSDALYRLAELTQNPWRQIADGITLSGAEQTCAFAAPQRAGLLPDSFVLATQHRNPPFINPATLGASAIRYYGGNSIYDFRGLPENGLLIHAPCRVVPRKSTAHEALFVIDAWEKEPFFVVINRLPAQPQVKVNGRNVELSGANSYDAARGQLILPITGKSRVAFKF